MRERRGWVRIAAIAIGCAVVLVLALSIAASSAPGHSADFVAILPMLLVGILSSISLLGIVAFHYASRVPQVPAVAASFQRPPPFLRG